MAKILVFPIDEARRRRSNVDLHALRKNGGAKILVFTGVIYSRPDEASCEVARRRLATAGSGSMSGRKSD